MWALIILIAIIVIVELMIHLTSIKTDISEFVGGYEGCVEGGASKFHSWKRVLAPPSDMNKEEFVQNFASAVAKDMTVASNNHDTTTKTITAVIGLPKHLDPLYLINKAIQKKWINMKAKYIITHAFTGQKRVYGAISADCYNKELGINIEIDGPDHMMWRRNPDITSLLGWRSQRLHDFIRNQESIDRKLLLLRLRFNKEFPDTNIELAEKICTVFASLGCLRMHIPYIPFFAYNYDDTPKLVEEGEVLNKMWINFVNQPRETIRPIIFPFPGDDLGLKQIIFPEQELTQKIYDAANKTYTKQIHNQKNSGTFPSELIEPAVMALPSPDNSGNVLPVKPSGKPLDIWEKTTTEGRFMSKYLKKEALTETEEREIVSWLTQS